jgi:hypothetical protein
VLSCPAIMGKDIGGVMSRGLHDTHARSSGIGFY